MSTEQLYDIVVVEKYFEGESVQTWSEGGKTLEYVMGAGAFWMELYPYDIFMAVEV